MFACEFIWVKIYFNNLLGNLFMLQLDEILQEKDGNIKWKV